MIDFLIKSTLSLGVLYAVYIFLLEKEKMHQFNRFYLLFGLAFSFLIPFITFEIYVETVSVATVNNTSMQAIPFTSVLVEEKIDYIPSILWSIYILITSVLIFRFVVHLIKIKRKITSNASEKIKNATLILLNEKVLPHTFLNYIFINKDDFKNRKIEDELFTHELTHVNQKHTFDILFIELLKTIFWFNPLFISYKRAIQLNHEFLADEKVVTSYNNVPFYQTLLVEKASWNNTFYLASNLNFLVTKKRLIMMTKTTSKKMLMFKKIALIPILTGMMYLFCVETIAQQKNQTPKTNSETPTISDDKKLDEYYAGVRFKLYRNGYNTKKEVIGKDLIFDKEYKDLTPEDKLTFKTWLKIPKATQKNSPTPKEFEEFKNAKKFAIWIDGKNVPNSELNKYKPKEIAYFSGSVILKNARTKKHPQPFQYWFYTHPYFDKNEMGKQSTKYGGDKVEIFEKYDYIAEESINNLKGTSEKPIKEDQVDSKLYQEYLKKYDKLKANDNQTNLYDQELIYNQADKKPDFPGGIVEFYSFVGKNFKVPEAKVNGKVYIQFVVEKEGSLTHIKVLRDLGHGTGEEAIRVLKLSPNWIPGEHEGKKVRVMYSLPISIQS